MPPKRKSLFFVHTAVFLFGLAGLFGKWVALPAVLIVFGRVAFAFLFLTAVLAIRRRSPALTRGRDYFYMALMGLILAAHWTFFYRSIQVSTVAVGLLTFSTFPVFVTFLEPFFFNERLKKGDILIALVTFLGVALVIPRFEAANRITQGVLWGVGSGLTFAILSVMNRKFAERYSGLVITFYQDLTAMIILLPLAFSYTGAWRINDILALAFLGVVCTGIAHALFINALKLIKAHTAGIVACLEPVYGILLAAFLLNEIPDPRVVIGGVVILGAVIYVSLRAAIISDLSSRFE